MDTADRILLTALVVGAVIAVFLMIGTAVASLTDTVTAALAAV